MSAKRGPCPMCNKGPHDKACITTVSDRGTRVHCFRCGHTSIEHTESVAEDRPAAPRGASLEWSTTAEFIWCQTIALIGSVGEKYLATRGCRLPPADGHLRFLPANAKYPPSLCGLITDSATGTKLSLHFTRLALDGRGKAGTDCDKLLLRGHRKRGGVIRLWPSEAVTTGLAIAEGIETALAAAHLFTPAWAAVDAGNLAAFPVLPGIEALTVFADHDEAGMRAARECGRRWRAAGREARIRRPRTPGSDVADLAQRVAA